MNDPLCVGYPDSFGNIEIIKVFQFEKSIFHAFIDVKATGGGSEGQKLSKAISKDLVEMKKMLKSASKNIMPSPNYDFLKIAICL